MSVENNRGMLHTFQTNSPLPNSLKHGRSKRKFVVAGLPDMFALHVERVQDAVSERHSIFRIAGVLKISAADLCKAAEVKPRFALTA